MDKITEQELADRFVTVKTIEGCKDFTNYIYTNAVKLEPELYQRAVIAINRKRKELEDTTYTKDNLNI